jgi:hypothetical protein
MIVFPGLNALRPDALWDIVHPCRDAGKPTFVGNVTQKVAALYSSRMAWPRDSDRDLNPESETIRPLPSTMVRFLSST